MKPGGYIALYRSLLEHSLMNQLPAAWFRVFIAILLKANWKPVTWWDGEREVQIKQGQLVTSVEKLSKMAHVSVKQTRGCLKYLAAANTAAIETTSRYTVITILNWETYQVFESVEGKSAGNLGGEVGARTGQGEGKGGATIEEGNKENTKDGNKKPTSARAELAVIDGTQPLAILGELREIYYRAGLPIPPRHEQLAVQYLLNIPCDKRHRVADYVKHCLITGKWRGPTTTKGLLNLLRDGDWDIDIGVERTLPLAPAATQPSRREMNLAVATQLFKAERGEA